MTKTAHLAGFELKGGHPALDLINTLDNRFLAEGPVELLGGYADLLRLMQQMKLLSVRHAGRLAAAAKNGPANRHAAVQTLVRARKLREAAAAALYAALDGRAPAVAAVRRLEAFFLDASRQRRLVWNQSAKRSSSPTGAGWVWGGSDIELALPAWMLAQAVCELTTSTLIARVRACGSETCRWLFLDTSKNHTRRWCDMKICGNRMKARRLHARRKGGGT